MFSESIAHEPSKALHVFKWLGAASEGRARSTCSATAVNMPTAATIALQAGPSWPRPPILFFMLICAAHTLAPKRKSGEKTYMSLLHTGGENRCLFASRHSSTLCTASISLACVTRWSLEIKAMQKIRWTILSLLYCNIIIGQL
jgi:hypothetical protein